MDPGKCFRSSKIKIPNSFQGENPFHDKETTSTHDLIWKRDRKEEPREPLALECAI